MWEHLYETCKSKTIWVTNYELPYATLCPLLPLLPQIPLSLLPFSSRKNQISWHSCLFIESLLSPISCSGLLVWKEREQKEAQGPATHSQWVPLALELLFCVVEHTQENTKSQNSNSPEPSGRTLPVLNPSYIPSPTPRELPLTVGTADLHLLIVSWLKGTFSFPKFDLIPFYFWRGMLRSNL